METNTNPNNNLTAKTAGELRLGDRLLVENVLDHDRFDVWVVTSLELVGDDVEVNGGKLCTSKGNLVAVV